jgi:uncharacterized protein YecT (DUF1311 family)
MKKIALAACLIVAFCLGMAWAQSQAEMSNQAYLDYRAADAKLDRVYREVMDKTSGEQKAKIVAAEQAWIKYRDANADAEAFINKGGTIYPMVRNGALTRMTEARTRELAAFLSDMLSR